MTGSQQAIIFDWNGTLVADTALCLRATNETLAMLGVRPVSLGRYRDEYIVPLHHMYKAFGCKEKDIFARQKELVETFSAYYEARAPRLRPRRGARETLGQLRAAGHKTAILSNYTVENIKRLALRMKLSEQFDAVLANTDGTDVLRRGGKGGRVKAFMDMQNVKAAIVVGDTIEEIQIAQQHGFVSVALTDGVCSVNRLRAAKPDFLIRCLCEVPDIAAKVFLRKQK